MGNGFVKYLVSIEEHKMDNAKRAKILIQAMPYIKKFAGETIVVKYGGNAMINEDLKSAVMSDLVLMQLVGISVVLVHGGGPEINSMLEAVGKESEFKDGMRVTDQETIDIVQMVLAGKVNKSLVQHLEQHGGKALGMCGLDGRLLMADKMASAHDLGYVGEIRDVNPDPLIMAMKDGYIPIVASEVPMLKRDGIIKGGMIPKIDCCVEAVRNGVNRAHIIDGRIEHSILLELFSDEGIGTMFYQL